MYWSTNFLAVVFKKQEISQQVVARMGFNIRVFKNFPEVIPPDPQSGRGRPSPAPNTHCRPLAERGAQTLVPLNFSAVVAPLPVNEMKELGVSLDS